MSACGPALLRWLLSPLCVVLIHLRGCYACAASIPVVGFNAVLTSEHFGSFLTFGVLHAALLIQYIKAWRRPPMSSPSCQLSSRPSRANLHDWTVSISTPGNKEDALV